MSGRRGEILTTPTQQSGSGVYQSALNLRRNTSTSVYNSVFVGQPEGLRLDGTSTWANVQAGGLNLRGVVLANNNTPLRAAGNTSTGAFSSADVPTWFNGVGKNNLVVSRADLGTLALNANTFSLTAPFFLLPGTSLLLRAPYSRARQPTRSSRRALPAGLLMVLIIGPKVGQTSTHKTPLINVVSKGKDPAPSWCRVFSFRNHLCCSRVIVHQILICT
jgi:hypothetical protein